MNDLRFALRQLLNAPGFTLVAILTLGLGIGLSAGSFSLTNAFLLRLLPYPESTRLVRIFRTSPQSASRPLTPADMLALREAATSFTSIAIFNGDSYTLGEPGQPAELVAGMTVTADFLDVLQVQPSLGRGFAPGEDQPGRPAVAVITQRAWARRYGHDPSVIGRTVRINREPFTIVGVLPEHFDAPLVWGAVEVLVPRFLQPTYRTDRRRAWMHAVARLKPGVALRQAEGELGTIAARLSRDFPNENRSDGLRAVSLHDSNTDGVSRGLIWLMTGLSLTMLLIACANLASLQVARALGRVREFALRAALGGSRRQLMMPLLIESLVLGLAGGVLGLLIASWSNAIIGRLLIINNEEGFAIPLDGRVLLFATVCAVASGLAFGLVPAWLAARAPAAEALKEGSRSATAGPAHQRLKRALIVGEMALALALVGVAASFGVGAKQFFRREVGWKIDGLFAGSLALPASRYADDAQTSAFHAALLERLAALPGAQHVALTTGLPLSAVGRTVRLGFDGLPPAERGREPAAQIAAVSPDYFATIGVPLQQGAFFRPNLKADDPPVAVINEALARQFPPGISPLGRRVRISENDPWLEIVGVVGDVKFPVRIDAPETRLQLYRPLLQAPNRFVTLAVRAATPPETLAAAVRRTVAALDADLPVAQPGAVRAQVERNLSNVNLVIANLAISAAMGLLIAGVGLFGVISQLTAQRTRDIGVRIALGAAYGDIMRLVFGEAARLLGLGVLLGVPGFYALNTFLHRTTTEMQLPGFWLLLANVAALCATMLLACWLPARRAAQVNPIEALRSE